MKRKSAIQCTNLKYERTDPMPKNPKEEKIYIPKSTAETTIMILQPVIVDALFFCIGNILLRLDEELQNRVLFQFLVHVHMGLGPFELCEQHRVPAPI